MFNDFLSKKQCDCNCECDSIMNENFRKFKEAKDEFIAFLDDFINDFKQSPTFNHILIEALANGSDMYKDNKNIKELLIERELPALSGIIDIFLLQFDYEKYPRLTASFSHSNDKLKKNNAEK